jgi:predicted nucleic acid-binding protein
MSKLPNLTLIAVDQTVAEQAASLAAQHGLRGADAVYAAIAADTNSILISLDKEHLSRLQAQTPSNVLIALAEDS